MKKKYGLNDSGIVGCIFTPIGLFFTVMGVLVGTLTPDRDWDNPVGKQIFLYVMGGIGVIFLLTGLVLLYRGLRHRRLLRDAYEYGNKVDAKILGQKTDYSNRNSGIYRRLECSYTDDNGVVHVFRSSYLPTDVSGMLKSETVPLYLNRDYPDVGYVDVDAILPEIRIHG